MVSTHVQFLEVFATHEPPLARASATLSPPCGERAGRGVPIWFMVLMRAQKRKEASHELLSQRGQPCPRESSPRNSRTRLSALLSVAASRDFPVACRMGDGDR